MAGGEIWSTAHEGSVLELDLRANVCCALRPNSAHQLAVDARITACASLDLGIPRSRRRSLGTSQGGVLRSIPPPPRATRWRPRPRTAPCACGTCAGASSTRRGRRRRRRDQRRSRDTSTRRISWSSASRETSSRVAARRTRCSCTTSRSVDRSSSTTSTSPWWRRTPAWTSTAERERRGVRRIRRPGRSRRGEGGLGAAGAAGAGGGGGPPMAQQFVSAVCWRGEQPVLLAANSQGIIKVLQLVEG